MPKSYSHLTERNSLLGHGTSGHLECRHSFVSALGLWGGIGHSGWIMICREGPDEVDLAGALVSSLHRRLVEQRLDRLVLGIEVFLPGQPLLVI